MGLPVGAVTGISMRRASPLLLPCILTGGSRLFTPGLSFALQRVLSLAPSCVSDPSKPDIKCSSLCEELLRHL